MPSFAIHNICGLELLDKLEVSESDKNKFIIGNVLPDVSRIRKYNELDDLSKRKAIQRRKKETHFRENQGKIIEYPNCEIFLDKYKEDVENDIITLAYFFHLYTDYYYFTKIFNKIVTFYDENMNVTDMKKELKYVKINKTNEVVGASEFFSKRNNKGIYKEYSRCNSYLAKKHKFKIDSSELYDYVDQYGFLTNIDETNSLYAYYAIRKLEKYVNDIDIKKDFQLLIFREEDLDLLVKDVVDSFIKKYKKLLVKYCKVA